MKNQQLINEVKRTLDKMETLDAPISDKYFYLLHSIKDVVKGSTAQEAHELVIDAVMKLN